MKYNFYTNPTLQHKYNILFLIILSISQQIIAQELNLDIKSKDSIEDSIIKNIDFLKNHKSEKSIDMELKLFSEKLKKIGYFFNELDSVVKKSPVEAYFKLNKKIDSVYLNLKKINSSEFDTINISIESLDAFLDSISSTLEQKGELFSNIRLKNVFTHKKNLFAELNIEKSLSRKTNAVIVKGYTKFPISYLENSLEIKKGDIINSIKLNEISNKSRNLRFISEIKPPELLFTKDSTFLYLYLKKNKISNFDGLINFASDETAGGVSFTGYLNLELNNVLDKGESFSLLWKANGNQNQSFIVKGNIPYIFGSNFTPEIAFNIYKQDSSFLSTEFKSKLLYEYNNRSSFGITYTTESSVENSSYSDNDSISSFNNSFLGVIYNYQIRKQSVFNDNKLNLQINPAFGKRDANKQFKLTFDLQYIFDFNNRNSFYIRNKTGYLDSKNVLTNELYRIGGVNSIRGFDEESIFTSKFTFLNSEYRYLTSKKSYIYSIGDFGYYKPTNSNKNKTILGVGIGYLFKINNSQTNINYTFGKRNSENSLKENSRISITYKNFF